MEAMHRRCRRQERRAPRIEVSGSGALAELERKPPPESRPGKYARHEAAGPAPDGAQL